MARKVRNKSGATALNIRRVLKSDAESADSADDNRSEVQLTGDVHSQAKIVAPLLASVEDIYVFDGEFVQVYEQKGRRKLRRVTSKALGFELQAIWRFVDSRGETISVLRPEIFEYIQQRLQDDIKAVGATFSNPVFTESGVLVSGSRYLPDEKLLVLSDIELGDLPLEPSDQQIEDARDCLLDLISDFPFDDDASRAGALAIPLTLLLRPFIDGSTPIFLVTAPAPGTGKSLLTNALTYLVTGEESETMTFPDSDTELRKELMSSLRERPSVLITDNVDRVVEGAFLASTLTSKNVQQRVLGRSEMMHLEHYCVFIINGNALRFSDEIGRRGVLVKLDANDERPAERTGFKHSDLMGFIKDGHNRTRLLMALATLAQAWLSRGAPEPVHTRQMGSFERWRSVIGGCLELAGIPGLLDNADELAAVGNVERQELSDFVEAWHAEHGTSKVGVAELFPMVKTHNLLGTVVGTVSDHGGRTKLGKKLDSVQSRIFRGYKIQSLGMDRRRKTRVYRLIQLVKTAKESDSEDASSIVVKRRRKPSGT